MLRYVCLAAMVSLIMASPPAARAQDADVTGIWHANDGGTYYLREIGPEVYWYGEQDPAAPAWSNVAHGQFEQDGLLHLRWADVPKGGIAGVGELVLRLDSPSHLTLLSASGSGFGGNQWDRAQ